MTGECFIYCARALGHVYYNTFTLKCQKRKKRLIYNVEQWHFSLDRAAAGQQGQAEDGASEGDEHQGDGRREEVGHLHVLVQLELHPDTDRQQEDAAGLQK